jgi:hypothetical protein
MHTWTHDFGSVDEPAHCMAPAKSRAGSVSSTVKVKTGFCPGLRNQAASATALSSGLV